MLTATTKRVGRVLVSWCLRTEGAPMTQPLPPPAPPPTPQAWRALGTVPCRTLHSSRTTAQPRFVVGGAEDAGPVPGSSARETSPHQVRVTCRRAGRGTFASFWGWALQYTRPPAPLRHPRTHPLTHSTTP